MNLFSTTWASSRTNTQTTLYGYTNTQTKIIPPTL